jgi:hypothetical protein
MQAPMQVPMNSSNPSTSFRRIIPRPPVKAPNIPQYITLDDSDNDDLSQYEYIQGGQNNIPGYNY